MQRDPDVSVITLSDDDESGLDEFIARGATPVTNSRRISVLPETPDLPSPSVFLGKEPDEETLVPPTPIPLHTSSLLFQSARMSRQDAMNIPSSPPLPMVDSDSNDCLVLDDYISNGGPDGSPFCLSSAEHSPPLLGRRLAASVEFSDATTELLSSSSEDESLGLCDTEAHMAFFSSKAVSSHPTRIVSKSRTVSLASDPLSRINVPPVAYRPLRSSPPRTTTVDANRGERVRRTQEERERGRQFARDLSAANKKLLEAKDIASDITVVVDPRLLELLEDGKKGGGMQQRSASATGPATPRTLARRSMTSTAEEREEEEGEETAGPTDVLFAQLRAEGIQCRIEIQSTACAARWEIRNRRKWDPAIRMYVPLTSHSLKQTKHAAMVVLGSARFLDLVATKRVQRLAEIWRAALAVSRVFVVVLGLQRALRKTASVGTREFDRQMRQLLKDGTVPGTTSSNSRPLREDASTEESVELAILELQLACPWITWFTQCADAKALGRLLHRTTVDLALHELTHKEDGAEAGGGYEPRDGCYITDDVATALQVASIKTGASLKESWALALTQIPKVTLPVAQAIAAKYPTPQRLFAAWAESQPASETLLADIVVPSASSGGRRLGSVMSARIYKVLTEPDPARPFAEL